MALFARKKSSRQPRRRTESQSARRGDTYDENTDNLFRRGRTITGSSSSHIASSGDDTDLVSARTRAHQLTRARRKIALVLAVVAVGLGLMLFLLTQFTVRTSLTRVDAGATRDIQGDHYQSLFAEYFAQYPLQRFRFALDENRLLAYIQQDEPHIEHIELIGAGSELGTSEFRLTVRTPVASWQIADQQYYVDQHGIAFQVNYFDEPVVRIVDDSGASIGSASQIIASNRLLSFTGRFVALSAESGVIITQIRISPDTTRQLELSIQDKPTIVRVTVDRPVGEQVEDAARALRYLEGRGQAPATLDVRVSGRAAYR